MRYPNNSKITDGEISTSVVFAIVKGHGGEWGFVMCFILTIAKSQMVRSQHLWCLLLLRDTGGMGICDVRYPNNSKITDGEISPS